MTYINKQGITWLLTFPSLAMCLKNWNGVTLIWILLVKDKSDSYRTNWLLTLCYWNVCNSSQVYQDYEGSARMPPPPLPKYMYHLEISVLFRRKYFKSLGVSVRGVWSKNTECQMTSFSINILSYCSKSGNCVWLYKESLRTAGLHCSVQFLSLKHCSHRTFKFRVAGKPRGQF